MKSHNLRRGLFRRPWLWAGLALILLAPAAYFWISTRGGAEYYGAPELLLPSDTACVATWRNFKTFLEQANQLEGIREMRQDEDLASLLLLTGTPWAGLEKKKNQAQYRLLSAMAKDFVNTWFGREVTLALLAPRSPQGGSGLLVIARTDIGFEENLAELAAQLYPELSLEEHPYRGHKIYRYNARKTRNAFSYCRFGKTVVVSLRSDDFGWLEELVDRKIGRSADGTVRPTLAARKPFLSAAAWQPGGTGLQAFLAPKPFIQAMRFLPSSSATGKLWQFWMDYLDEELKDTEWGALRLWLGQGLHVRSFWKSASRGADAIATNHHTGKPPDRQTGRPTDRPTGEPANRQTGEPANRQTGEPANWQTGEPANRQTGEPANRQTGEPANWQTGEPADRPTGEPANRPTGRLADRPTGEPANRQTGEPADRQTDRYMDGVLRLLPRESSVLLIVRSPYLADSLIRLRNRMAESPLSQKRLIAFEEKWRRITGLDFANDCLASLRGGTGAALTGLTGGALLPLPQAVAWWDCSDEKRAAELAARAGRHPAAASDSLLTLFSQCRVRAEGSRVIFSVNGPPPATAGQVTTATALSERDGSPSRLASLLNDAPVSSAPPVVCFAADLEKVSGQFRMIHAAAELWPKKIRKNFYKWETASAAAQHLSAIRLTVVSEEGGTEADLLISVH